MHKQRLALGRLIGKGGYGEVYEASYDAGEGLVLVAVKLLARDLGSDADALARLRDEATVLRALNHPSIVKVIDQIEVDGRTALVTELVPGEDLSRLLPAPSKALVELLGQIADALAAARGARGSHGEALHLVHRDIKPSNIRLRPDGRAVLLDFGVARTSAPREARTASHRVIGSLPYMAPESFVERTYTGATDVFALGAVLYEGLAGQRLLPKGMLRNASSMALDPGRYHEFLDDRLRALPDLPRQLEYLLADLLSFTPEKRPTAAEIVDRCTEVAPRLPGPALAAFCAASTPPHHVP